MPTPLIPRRRAVALATTLALTAGAAVLAAPAALADGTNCYDGSAQPLGTTVTCDAANDVILTVPDGTTSLTFDVVGAGGGSSFGADGGDPYELEGHATLPSGTVYLRVVTGQGGVAGAGGAGGSSVAALDGSQQLLGRLVVAGAGGSAGLTTDADGQVSAGKDANSPGGAASVGTVNGGGSALSGTGGAGGTGPGGGIGNGAAGQDADDASPVPAAGGDGGTVDTGPILAVGGRGGGGYAGGGGGAAGNDGIAYSAAGGGGGNSYASGDVYDLNADVTAGGGQGGTNGADGVVYVTFNGTPPPPASNVPTVPVAPEYHPGYTSMRVFFHKPFSDGGSPILGYRISLNGGATWSAPLAYTGPATGPYWTTVTGLRPGASYQVRMQAWNANGYGGAIRPPATVMAKALTVPSVPVGIEAAATATPGQVRLFWREPVDEGGSPILGYRVSLNGGGTWSGPLRVYGPATGPFSASVSGLVPGRTYQVRMQAWNAQGYGGSPRTPVAITVR